MQIRAIKVDTRRTPNPRRMNPRTPCEVGYVASARFKRNGFKIVAQRHGGKRHCRDCEFQKICRLSQNAH